jgi:molybdopterin-guanine dinucleotide biosynthesis protein A
MIVDAVVLAGGRSSRLGSEPKAGLLVEGRTLLARTVDAASVARQTVVVGDEPQAQSLLPTPLLSSVLHTRETPVFGGPAAGLAAGLTALAAAIPTPSEFVLVLACDMPWVAAAVPVLLAAAGSGRDGALAVDSAGSTQYLAGVYRTTSLGSAVLLHKSELTDLSMRALLRELELAPTAVPTGSTDDIDTWSDAARYGITARATAQTNETALMKETT